MANDQKKPAETALGALLDILDLEPLEDNLFRGVSPKVGWQRVYGGQVLGQALIAAARTVTEPRSAHSLHGYFLLAGDPAHRIRSSTTSSGPETAQASRRASSRPANSGARSSP
jgi:acyl-CoA thioesterase